MAKLIRPATVCIAFFLLLVSCVATTAQTRSARVIAEKAHLRESPRTVGLAKDEVAEGAVVKVLDEKLPWYVVRIGDSVGWMHGATLIFIDDATSETEPVRVRKPVETYSIPQPARSSADRGYIRGPRGGCYYISGSGRKVYVDRSLCN